jgi:hypothetical protein
MPYCCSSAHHLLGQAVVGALQLAEQQARHARVPGHEVDVRHEHGLQRGGRASGLRGRLVDAREQASLTQVMQACTIASLLGKCLNSAPASGPCARRSRWW